MKSAFLVKAHQFAYKDACWYLHEDLPPFLRYLKNVLEAAKSKGRISKFFLSSRGCAVFFPADLKYEDKEIQLQIIEPWGQILCHMTDPKDFTCPDVWERIKCVNKHQKPKPGKLKYFDYKQKKFVIENRPGYVSKKNGNKRK